MKDNGDDGTSGGSGESRDGQRNSDLERLSHRSYTATAFGRYEGLDPAEPPANEVLVGRKHQRARLLSLLGSHGKKGAYLVTGYRGSGKTELVRHCLAEYRGDVFGRMLRSNVGRTWFWDRLGLLAVVVGVILFGMFLSDLLEIILLQQPLASTSDPASRAHQWLTWVVALPIALLTVHPIIVGYGLLSHAKRPRPPGKRTLLGRSAWMSLTVLHVLGAIMVGAVLWFVAPLGSPVNGMSHLAAGIATVYFLYTALSTNLKPPFVVEPDQVEAPALNWGAGVLHVVTFLVMLGHLVWPAFSEAYRPDSPHVVIGNIVTAIVAVYLAGLFRAGNALAAEVRAKSGHTRPAEWYLLPSLWAAALLLLVIYYVPDDGAMSDGLLTSFLRRGSARVEWAIAMSALPILALSFLVLRRTWDTLARIAKGIAFGTALSILLRLVAAVIAMLPSTHLLIHAQSGGAELADAPFAAVGVIAALGVVVPPIATLLVGLFGNKKRKHVRWSDRFNAPHFQPHPRVVVTLKALLLTAIGLQLVHPAIVPAYQGDKPTTGRLESPKQPAPALDRAKNSEQETAWGEKPKQPDSELTKAWSEPAFESVGKRLASISAIGKLRDGLYRLPTLHRLAQREESVFDAVNAEIQWVAIVLSLVLLVAMLEYEWIIRPFRWLRRDRALGLVEHERGNTGDHKHAAGSEAPKARRDGNAECASFNQSDCPDPPPATHKGSPQRLGRRLLEALRLRTRDRDTTNDGRGATSPGDTQPPRGIDTTGSSKSPVSSPGSTLRALLALLSPIHQWFGRALGLATPNQTDAGPLSSSTVTAPPMPRRKKGEFETPPDRSGTLESALGTQHRYLHHYYQGLAERTFFWDVYGQWLPTIVVRVNLGFDSLDHRRIVEAMLEGLGGAFHRTFIHWRSRVANYGRIIHVVILLLLTTFLGDSFFQLGTEELCQIRRATLREAHAPLPVLGGVDLTSSTWWWLAVDLLPSREHNSTAMNEVCSPEVSASSGEPASRSLDSSDYSVGMSSLFIFDIPSMPWSLPSQWRMSERISTFLESLPFGNPWEEARWIVDVAASSADRVCASLMSLGRPIGEGLEMRLELWRRIGLWGADNSQKQSSRTRLVYYLLPTVQWPARVPEHGSPRQLDTDRDSPQEVVVFRAYHAIIFALLLLLGKGISRQWPVFPYRRLYQRIDLTRRRLSERLHRETRTELPGVPHLRAWLGMVTRTQQSDADPADPRTIEVQFLRILDEIQDIGVQIPGGIGHRISLPVPEVIFVFDELDKMGAKSAEAQGSSRDVSGEAREERSLTVAEVDLERRRTETLNKLFADMKNILSVAPARFIFIGGRNLHDEWLGDQSSRIPMLSNIFNAEIYIPSLLTETNPGMGRENPTGAIPKSRFTRHV